MIAFTSIVSHATVIDTTKVRITKKVKKTTAEIIGDIPGEILKLPFYILDFSIEQITFHTPMKNVLSWIGTPRPAAFYTPVAGYNSSAGFKYGISFKFQDVYSKNDYFKTKIYYSTNKYQSYQIKTRSKDFFTKDFGFDFYFRYKKRPREDFFGVSNQSVAHMSANYNLENTEVKTQLLYNAYEQADFSFILGYLSTNLYNGENPDLPGDLDSITSNTDYHLADGNLDDSRFITYGMEIEYDLRNNKGQPSSGTHLISQLIRYRGVGLSDDLRFSKYSIDVRQYLHLWKNRIIALRAVVNRLNAYKNNTKATPIYILSSLGGKDYLRGYSSGRFVDNDFALFSVEYRYPIHDFLDLFLFHDQARVYGNLTDEEFFTNWKSSFGGGMRIWKSDEVKAVFQIGKSNEATKLYLEMEAVW